MTHTCIGKQKTVASFRHELGIKVKCFIQDHRFLKQAEEETSLCMEGCLEHLNLEPTSVQQIRKGLQSPELNLNIIAPKLRQCEYCQDIHRPSATVPGVKSGTAVDALLP